MSYPSSPSMSRGGEVPDGNVAAFLKKTARPQSEKDGYTPAPSFGTYPLSDKLNIYSTPADPVYPEGYDPLAPVSDDMRNRVAEYLRTPDSAARVETEV